jgi:NAD(P)-dependent dehydrogenase (short-subunit alcohol dehydrogenase family)
MRFREHLGTGPEGEANIRNRIARVPLGSILKPEDLARAALYLVSDDSAGVTGITHIVDGVFWRLRNTMFPPTHLPRLVS